MGKIRLNRRTHLRALEAARAAEQLRRRIAMSWQNREDGSTRRPTTIRKAGRAR